MGCLGHTVRKVAATAFDGRRVMFARLVRLAMVPAVETLAAFLRTLVSQLHTHQGLARTLATLMAARSDASAAGGRELDRVITDLLAGGFGEGTIRDDAGSGAVMMVVQGIRTARARRGPPGQRRRPCSGRIVGRATGTPKSRDGRIEAIHPDSSGDPAKRGQGPDPGPSTKSVPCSSPARRTYANTSAMVPTDAQRHHRLTHGNIYLTSVYTVSG